MRKALAITIIFLVCFCSILLAQGNKHSKATNYPSYKGLLMTGYQGWFRAPATRLGAKYLDIMV